MAQIFRIDLTSLSTHEERFSVSQTLQKNNFDVNEHWITVDDFQKTIDYIDATWFYATEPKFPTLPKCIKITQK